VIAGYSLSQAARALALVVPLSVCFLAGCAEGTLDGYPRSLTYPARADRLVLAVPKDTPFYSYPPGKLEEYVARIDKTTDGKTFDPTNPKNVPTKRRDELTKKLANVFGSPSRPRVFLPKDTSEEVQTLKDYLALDTKNLRKGATLYRRHCLHCHGVAGDGRGPTGPWLDPHPRDYRQGLFKFISTSNNLTARKPRRDDLIRTLHQGIEGTSMPAFGLLPEDEINALVSYVTHLSIRGEVEYETLKVFAAGNPYENDDGEGKVFANPDPRSTDTLTLTEYVDALTTVLLDQWVKASQTDPNKIPPPGPNSNDPKTGVARPESIVRGYKKFIEPAGDAACLSCHVDFGRQAPFRFDKWGTLARPANLTVPIYRGGRRPLDIYYRVSGGIEGCGMPANKAMTPEQFWDLVNFVQALPYPAMLPEEIREKIYVPHKEPETHARAGH
jgi:mono/diheme cytochrome c family protein